MSAAPTPPAWAAEPPDRHDSAPLAWNRFLTAAALLTIAGLAAGTLAWLRPTPRPVFVPLWVTQYRSPVLPPAPWTEADREAVRDAGFFPRGPDTYSSQEAVLLLREFQELGRWPANESIVVYLSAYAVPAADGDVTVWAADADPTREASSVRLSRLIQLAADAPARNLLLVLDLHEPIDDARAGGLRPDVPSRVPKLLEKAGDDGLRVLTACGPGQVAHWSPELGGTVFGYYFRQALAGAARSFHAAGQSADRRISARELAEFVQARVARWVWDNRGERQTPMYHGRGPDFDIVATARELAGPPPLPAVPPPPKWLREGWALLDAWREGVIVDSPRLYSRWQAAVRRANAGWPGPAGARAEQEFRFARQQLESQLAAARASLPRPTRPASLALAEVEGAVPDAAVTAAAVRLLADARAADQADAAAVRGKLVAAFLTASKDKSAFAVESALYTAALDVSEGRADLLAVIDQVFRGRGETPASIEGRFLRRLAALTSRQPPDQWPGDLARQALRAVRLVEQASARFALVTWARPALDACVQPRWEAELLLQFWGDVPAEPIDILFRRAAGRADALVTFADALHAARATADASWTSLDEAVHTVGQFADREPLWFDRLRATAELETVLTPPAAPLTTDELLGRLDLFRRGNDRLAQAMSAIPGGTADDLVSWLVNRSKRPDAGPVVLRPMELALGRTLLPWADHAALAQARNVLAGRLAAATHTLDAADDLAERPTRFAPESPAEAGAARDALARRAARVGRCEIALLQEAGLTAGVLDPLRRLLAEATQAGPDSPAWDRLADSLRFAWGRDLRELMARATPPRLERIAAIFPGGEAAPVLDSPPGGPRFARRRREAAAFLAWLAERYRYAARNGLDPAEFDDALANLGDHAGRQQTVDPELRGPGEPVILSADRPAGEARLTANRDAKIVEPPTVTVLLPDAARVRATVAVTDGPGDGGVRTSDVRVKLEVIGLIAGPLPGGVVVECRSGDRAAFARIPLASGPRTVPPDLIVGATPTDAAGFGDVIRLRPSEVGQPLFVAVRNRDAAARAADVKLTGPFPAMTVRVTLPPNVLTPVPLPPLAKPVTMDLPAELTVAVSDDKSGDALRERRLRLDLADASEYVEVVEAAYEPADAPSRPLDRLRFVLRARRTLGPVPCTAELVLDADSIPGFRGVTAGQLKGVVPADGGLLVLTAEGLRRNADAGDRGAASLTIDGVAGAFRFLVELVPFGSPTVPVLDQSPRMRLALQPPPEPGRSVRYRVGVDRAPAGSRLETRLLWPGGGVGEKVERRRELPAARQRRATVAAANGGLLVTPTIGDWDETWTTPQVLGRRIVQARLFAADGTVVLTEERPIELAESPPRGVRFVDLPERAVKGQALPVRASGGDAVAGVTGVTFYLGKPGPDGKPPAGTVTAAGRADAVPGTWSAELMLPETRTGPTDVTAVFVNAAGLTATANGVVEVVNEVPAKLGSITGTVTEGGRPQAGLTVVLGDEKGKPSQSATTAADGTFRFDGLKAGPYRVGVTKSATGRTAGAAVTVTAGKASVVKLELSL